MDTCIYIYIYTYNIVYMYVYVCIGLVGVMKLRGDFQANVSVPPVSLRQEEFLHAVKEELVRDELKRS